MDYSTHVFHQYTLKIKDGRRNELIEYLATKNIPSMIYYPIPLYKQEAFKPFTEITYLPVTEELCKEVFSIPIHTEMKVEEIHYIADAVKSFFNP
jgi:dTDP-4-amino-4,6-dideoxygalactose transaminase